MTWTLCVDAGPTENGHRTRGIGWYTLHLLEALRKESGARASVRGCYLRRQPLPAHHNGGREWEWIRRSWTAEWTGVSSTSLRLANWWQLWESLAVLPHDAGACWPDVVLATDPHAVALSSQFRTVAVLYDVIPLLYPDFRGPRGAMRRAVYHHRLNRLRRAHGLVAISEASRRDAVNLAGFDARQITVVYPGVDHDLFYPEPLGTAAARVAVRFGLERPFFLYVGEADQRKNLFGLASAVVEVAARHDISLAVAGVVRGRTHAVREQVATIDRSQRVRWLGYVSTDELRALYCSAAALAFPTLYEGFGLPVLEAMACGTPVITSAVSSLPEVAGAAAIYVDPTSGTDIVRGLELIISNPGLRAELGEKGRTRALTFSWSRTAREMLHVCEAVAATAR
jgi:glycosyltransferase involved in cell wall biosynthesis